MDQATKRFISDLLGVLVILAVGVLAFLYYGDAAILVADGLALTVWVAGDIILSRKG